MNKKALKAKITRALRRALATSTSEAKALVPGSFTAGKLYEAYALSVLCRALKAKEGYKLMLVGGSKVVLKSSPGPINVRYPHIQVTHAGAHVGDIWTDIEFTSLSSWMTGVTAASVGDYHELDLVMVKPGCAPRPLPDEILLGVECKHTGYQKRLLREILGVRRELSLLAKPMKTGFSTWPQTSVPADPPSCLIVYSSDPAVMAYSSPGTVFGISFFYEAL